MEYKVSEKVQKKFDTLTKDAKIQKALQFMEDDQNEIINRQIELTLIPAPTNHERKKQRDFLRCLRKKDSPTAISTSTATALVSGKVPAAERQSLWKVTWIRYSRLNEAWDRP